MENQNIIELLFNNYDEEDVNIQKRYYEYMDKIIDAHILLKYQEDKKKKLFYTVDQIHTYVINYFRKIDFYNEETILNELATNLSYCTKKEDEIPYYINILKKLFEYYVTKEPDDNLATNFFNEILNKQQGLYFSQEKRVLIEKIKLYFPMTSKKSKNISIGIKLKILLETKNIKYLNIPDEDMLHIKTHVRDTLKYKNNLKNAYPITEEDYKYIDLLFLEGNLNDEKLKERFPLLNKRQIKTIKNAYYKELLLYLDTIQVKKDNIDLCYLSRIIEFNHNHIKFYNKKKELENIKLFIGSLTLEEKKLILNDNESITILKELLPLINIIETFDTNTFKNIILNFSKIKQYLNKEKNILNDINITTILNNLLTIIELSNIYKKAQNPYIISVLGEKILQKILSDAMTSREPEDYICTYIKMLENYKSYIPPITGQFENYIYESGNNKIERLLIGKNVDYSCLGPKGAGEDAYYECLCELTADVLIIKDKDTGVLVGRSVLFRRGNFIIIAPFYEQIGINDELYNKNFLLKITNDIIEQSKKNNDCIDYIFIGRHDLLEGIFPIYINYNLISNIPHSDIEECVHILYSKNQNIKINQESKIITTYWKEREKIQFKIADYLNDIKKIESLRVLSTCETEFINPNEEFYKIDTQKYDGIYLGQDWYIAIQNGEIQKQCLCKVSDPRQELEIEETIKLIKEQQKRKIYYNKKD